MLMVKLLISRSAILARYNRLLGTGLLKTMPLADYYPAANYLDDYYLADYYTDLFHPRPSVAV